jgi:hypothetical protein
MATQHLPIWGIKYQYSRMLPNVLTDPCLYCDPTMVPSFLNLFLITGPKNPPSGHSMLVGIECTVDYIIWLIAPIFFSSKYRSRKGYQSLEVTKEAHEYFNVL